MQISYPLVQIRTAVDWIAVWAKELLGQRVTGPCIAGEWKAPRWCSSTIQDQRQARVNATHIRGDVSSLLEGVVRRNRHGWTHLELNVELLFNVANVIGNCKPVLDQIR